MTRRIATLTPLLSLILITACTAAATPPTPTPGVGLANPASVNCVDQGGQLEFRTDGSGGQYGVCLFDDNRQCEEWAMLRGDCPVGGLKVTGYLTEAAVFCAISGGQYSITANSGTAEEEGDCTLPSGTVCPATAYFERTCG
jgi:putative hemolysin